MSLPQGASQLAYLAKNATLAVRISVGALGTDPAVFAVQATRRLPAGPRQLLGTGLSRTPWVGTQAMGALMTGDKEALALSEQRLRAGQRRADSISTRLGWEVLAAANLVDLEHDKNLPPVTLARALWSAGRLTEACAIANTSGKKRLAKKLAAEATLLQETWFPQLNENSPATGAARPGRRPFALHLITNSLPATQSGYTLRTHRLLTALAQRGVNLRAETRTGYPVTVGKLDALPTARVEGITYRRHLPWKLASYQPQKIEQWVRHLAYSYADNPPALIHTTTHFHNGLVARSLARYWNIPWVYEVRGILEETWLSHQPEARRESAAASERFALTRARETQIMQAADHLITLSETMKRTLVERGLEPQKITVVPNSVDESLFDLDLTPAQARQKLGLSAEGFWYGSVSSLVPYEGFDTLIRALAVVRQQGIDARLMLAGDGSDRVRLEALTRSLGLEEYTVFLGKVDPHTAYTAHQALDVFTVPRTRDRVCQSVTPLKPIEAMALNRPLLVSDLAPLTELVENRVTGPTGLIASAGDPGSFARQLCALATDEDLRRGMSQQGRIFARTRTWAQNARTVQGIYNRLTDS
ncbi:glycosyltransferase family 4 protein [Rothia sp. CCM 9416]|uniref:glycosyltransferase family 4 protein n=1 Tax=Rothia sp. CCM 9416 TaxID=3402655 RepID=UPI003ADE72D4